VKPVRWALEAGAVAYDLCQINWIPSGKLRFALVNALRPRALAAGAFVGERVPHVGERAVIDERAQALGGLLDRQRHAQAFGEVDDDAITLSPSNDPPLLRDDGAYSVRAIDDGVPDGHTQPFRVRPGRHASLVCP
jgi:hypothetical protein